MEINEPEMYIPVIVIPKPKPLVHKPDKKEKIPTRSSRYFKNYFNFS